VKCSGLRKIKLVATSCICRKCFQSATTFHTLNS